MLEIGARDDGRSKMQLESAVTPENILQYFSARRPINDGHYFYKYRVVSQSNASLAW